MRPTRIATLVALLLGCGAVSWGVLRIMEDRGQVLPPLPWGAPFGIAGLAVVVLVSALSLRGRMRGRPGSRPPQPLGVARMAVLGKASAHVGPLLGGLYGGFLVLLLSSLGVEARRDRAIVAAVALLASVALSAAGVFLERICRVEGPSEDDPPAAVSGP